MPIPVTAIASLVFRTAGGAAAVGTISQVARETSQLTSTLLELSKNSLQVGADFQSTVSSLSFVSGSASKAKQELAELNATVQNSVGLELKSAETGYNSLRQLGVQADTARRIIKELGEIKVLSPEVDANAVQRVIYNFNQLANGSSRASADIKEVLHNMPALRKHFIEAFGTLDAEKIFASLKSPDEFVERLLASMEKTSIKADGVNNSYRLLNNQIEKSKREFATFTLEPTKKAYEVLTAILVENKDTFKEWGRGVGQAITIATEIINSGTVRAAANLFQFLNLPLQALGSLADYQRRNSQPKGKSYEEIAQEEKMIRDAKIQEKADAEFKAQQVEENSKQNTLKRLERFNSIESLVLENNYRVREAGLISYLSRTFAQEVAHINANAKLKNEYIQNQISQQRKFFDLQIQLNQNDKEKVLDLTAEKNKALNDLNTQLILNQIETFKRLSEIRQREREQYRNDLIEEKRLKSQEISLSFNSRSFDLNQRIDFGNGGFDELKQLTIQNYQKIIQITREQYALQLQDETLTAQQKINIQTRLYIDLQNLAEQNRQRILEIEEKEFTQRIQKINQFAAQQKAIIDGGATSLGQIDFSRKGGAVSVLSSQFYNFDDVNLEVQRLKTEISATKTIMDSLDLAISKEPKSSLKKMDLSRSFAGQEYKLQKLTEQLNRLEFPTGLNKQMLDLMRLGNQFDAGKISIQDFDKAQKLLLETTQEYNLYGLEKQKERLTDLVKKYKDEKKEIEADNAKIQLNAVIDKIDQTKIQNAIDLNKQFQESSEGLRQDLAKWQSGDSVTWLKFFDGLQKQDYKRQISEIQELAKLQKQLSEKGIYNPNTANLLFLEGLNQRIKSVNEISADFRLGLADGVLGPIESLFDKINQKIEKLPVGIREVGSAFANLFREIIKQAANKFIMRLFGLDSGASSVGNFGSSGAGLNPLNFLTNSGNSSGGFNLLGGNPLGNNTSSGGFNLLGGNAGRLSKIPVLGKLFGGGAASAIGAANGPSVTALAGGLSTTGTLSSTIGLQGGGTATATTGGGFMSSMGSFLTNPWTAVVAGGIVSGILLFKFFRERATLNKLKKAAMAAYSIDVKEKSILKNLKTIGDAYYGKGKAGENADGVVKLEESQDVLRNHAIATGQNTNKLDRSKMGDQNWLGNQFSTPLQFGGFREFGGEVRKNIAYVVGEKRPEIFVPHTNGTILPSVNSSGNDSGMMRVMMTVMAQMQSTIEVLATKLNGISPGDILRLGASDASDAIADAYESELQSNSNRTDRFMRLTGQGF